MTRLRIGAAAQPIDQKRRSPKQGRALDTLEVIFEATAQILEAEGAAALSTNRIAVRAGISVGTLYQYFSNKRAILRALAERECRRLSVEVSAGLADAAVPARDRRRAAVRAFLSAFEGRRELHRAILRDVLPSDEALSKALDDFVAGLGEADGQRAFIQTHAVVGAIRAAVLAHSPHLATRAFEDEILRLIDSDGAAQDR
jgi:AcrR family transcriptional regulator